jgi:hypothetical protein
VLVVGRRSDPPNPNDDVYMSFVRELAASPERASLLVRLRLGHEPDEFGWRGHRGTHTIGSGTHAPRCGWPSWWSRTANET